MGGASEREGMERKTTNLRVFHETVDHTINIQSDGESENQEKQAEPTPTGKLTHDILKESNNLNVKKKKRERRSVSQ